MCERIVIPDRSEVEHEIPVAHRWWSFTTRFNVFFPERVPAVRMHESESEGVMMRWGFIPAATKASEIPLGQPSIESGAIDADAYRPAWSCGQRCIVPLAGFYVWKRVPAGYRQPFYVRLANRLVFGVAALWDRFVTDDDDVIEGCAFVTVAANKLLAEMDERGRMPVILRRADYQAWLQGSAEEARGLLRTYPTDAMLVHAVGPRVNFPEFDDPSLIRPVASGTG